MEDSDASSLITRWYSYGREIEGRLQADIDDSAKASGSSSSLAFSCLDRANFE